MAMPFQRVREMRNAHTAGKIDKPTTRSVAGPANAHPVSPRARTPLRLAIRQRRSGLASRLVESTLGRGRALQDLRDLLADVAGHLHVPGHGRPWLFGVDEVVEELLGAGRVGPDVGGELGAVLLGCS